MNKYSDNISKNVFKKDEKIRHSLKTSEEIKIQINEYSPVSLSKYNLFFENEKIFMDSILEIYLDSIKKISALRKNAKQIIGTAFFQGRDFLNEKLGKCLEDINHVKYFMNKKRTLSSHHGSHVKSDRRRRKSKKKRRNKKKLTCIEDKIGTLYDKKMYEYLKNKDYPLYNNFVNKIGAFTINGKES